MIKKVDWSIRLTAFAVIVSSILDLFGVLDNVTWLSDRIPKIILLLLGILVLILNKSMQDILLAVKTNKNSGIDILEFDDASEIYNYISKQYLRARTSIDDITWGSYTGYRTEEEQNAYERYVKTMQKVCKRQNIMYKEISSLSDSHYFSRAKSLFGNYNYHLGYHDIKGIEVPLISYAIIDNEEVVCGFSRVPGQVRPLDGIKYLSIRNPIMVKFFKDYYDTIWNNAIKLKESLEIDEEKISKIESELMVVQNDK